MNVKTVRTGNVLASNAGEHYFVDIHKTKHFHRKKSGSKDREECEKTNILCNKQ